MQAGFMDDDVIIIKAPRVERIPVPTMHSAFNLLNKSTRASFVGNVAEGREEFSKDIPHSDLWIQDYDGLKSVSLYLKVPGTDFYLPRELVQFQRPLEKIVDYHYNSGKTKPWNRNGSEYWHLMAYQHVETADRVSSAQEPHLDMDVHEVVAQGTGFNDERYLMSDIDEMNTVFFDVDLGLKEEDFVSTEKEYWNRRVQNILIKNASAKKTFSAFDIGHFDSTTGHMRDKPAMPVRRTFMSVGAGSGYAPRMLSHATNNLWLDQALATQGRIFTSSLLYAPV